MFALYRKPIYLKEKSEACGIECFDVGPLRASFFGIRVPVRWAKWYYGLR